MNGIATVCGCSINSGKIVFSLHMNIGKQKHIRVVPVTLKSTYAAELAGVKYALLAANRRPETDLLLKVHSKNLPGIFARNEKGDWKKIYKSNHEIISQLRLLSEEFQSFTCETDRGCDNMAKIKKIAQKSCDLVLGHSESE